ncbi:peptidyl-prolyl cis-trans isomerase FKBP4-like [Stegodyphus dumicola]|uniref:peptidyl-prolyl cis-trans isomerase FKBP4-like n=1 Tax=Stegodyphus dumicola TaxID=202533 RepID=UPI0015B0C5DC|nr:peptidyl-prolyl cis-trans isomerase FKBP4-like [Stegodyphus dumicola]XP_035217778.1 peptidyl-prolyl cis-trans isomerase FKBP4-like [Stegodyphus dumicola]XP_035217779.1 peptidyl-prolyl cis-trans isomerase FKBP4-like [Stegodyphus dumicola]
MSLEVEKMESDDFYVPGPDAMDISPNQDGGVLKTIVSPGEGDETPCKGDKVFVHYTGKLMDGTKFDSSVDRGEMFEFTLGKGEVIKAWDIGVGTMKKGEKCTLVCHPDYAYGKKGSAPKIPENATLVFDIELIKWQMEDLSPNNDNGILRSLIKEGQGHLTPGDGATVEVHLTGSYEGNVFEERDVKFEIGEGSEVGVVEGLDIALKKFKRGEKSKIILSPKYAFGPSGNSDLNVPPNSTVEYEVTLKSFEKEKESWNMTAEEKLEQSEIVKNKGTNYFKNGKYELATKQYKKIINYLQYESDLEGEAKEKKNTLLVAGYLNLAACYLKLENHHQVIENCDKALEIESKNAKGLFRKGQAYLALKDYEVAKDNFERVLEVDASNKAAQKNIYMCNESIKKQLAKEKKMYQAIFKKMAEESVEEPDSNSQKNEATAEDSSMQENGHVEKMETDDEKQAAAEAVKV